VNGAVGLEDKKGEKLETHPFDYTYICSTENLVSQKLNKFWNVIINFVKNKICKVFVLL